MSEYKPQKSPHARQLLIVAALVLAVIFMYPFFNFEEEAGGMPTPGDAIQLAPEPGQRLEGAANTETGGRLERRMVQAGIGPLGSPARQPSLPSGLPISGWVLSQDGSSLPGMAITAAAVRLFAGDPGNNAAEVHQAASDSSGLFRFESLPDGDYLLQTAPSDLYPIAQRLVRAGNQQADLVVADGRNTLFAVGRISNTDREPVEKVQVSLPARSSSFAFSDMDGYYLLEFIAEPQRPNTLQFRHPDYHLFERILEPSDFDGTDLLSLDVMLKPLERTANVSGLLMDAAGQVVPQQDVSLYSEEFRRHYAARSDTTGEFHFPQVAVGADYRLQVLPETSYRDHTQIGIEVPDGGLELTIVLEPVETGNLAGLMVNTEGEPIADFSLQLVSQSARAQQFVIRSDSVGEFNLADVPAGRIGFFSRSEPRLSANGLLLEAGETRDVTLVLDWGPYVLQGQVVDSKGSPVPAAPITLTWSARQGDLRNHSVRTAVADQAGNFLFTQLGSGWHKLNIHVPGYQRFGMEEPVGRESRPVQLVLERLVSE